MRRDRTLRLTLVIALLAAVGCASAATPASTSHPRSSRQAAATLATAPVGANPDWDDLDPRTDTVYVANGGTGAATGNTVSVVNGRACRTGDIAGCERRSATVNVGAAPFALAVDSTTDTIYVPNGKNTVAVIDGTTCNADDTSGCSQRPPEVKVGRDPSSVAIDPANHTAYVTDAGGNDVSMINTKRCKASKLTGCRALRPPTVAVGVGPADVAVDESTHTVYVTNDDEDGPNDGKTMSAFDATTCNAIAQRGCSHQGLIHVGTGPLAVTVDDKTNTIFTGNHSVNLSSGAPSREGTVSVINGRTCDAADLSGCRTHAPGTVLVGWGPDEEVLDEPAYTLYVSNVHGDNQPSADGTLLGTVSVIDTDACRGTDLAACRRTVAATVQTGEYPDGLAVDPLTRSLYVANDGDSDVSVIDVAECDAAHKTGCQTR
jgi:DNA-binding beta-propeller fold protein YncE